jgi:secretion/DNA translocation related TadE-like protein
MKTEINEDGNVTVLAVALCAIALVFIIGLGRIGGFTGIKAKAQNAADAASLSAAYDIAHFNPSKACDSAKKTASSNGAVLEVCDKSSYDVKVVVSIDHDGKTVKAEAKAFVK